MGLSRSFGMQQELFIRSVGVVLAGGIVNGVLADLVSLFNPNPNAPISVYDAGVTNGITTYLLGCNASASATRPCDFTAPITMIDGPSTFHAEVTTWLRSDKTQSLTVDCPSGTTGHCSGTALNSDWQTTTVSLSPSDFSKYIVAIPIVTSSQALLYNGIPLATASGSKTDSSSTALATSTSSSSPTTSPNTGSSQTPSSKSTNYAWIAGAVIGPLLVILLIIAGLFYRQKKKIGTERETADKKVGGLYQKPELHGDSLIRPRVQVDVRPRSELPAREPAASELF